METRMSHPLHGFTHAYSTQEVEKHKALGWVVEGESVSVINGDTSAPSPQEVIEGRKADVADAAPLVKWSNEAELGSVPAQWEAPKRKPGRSAKAK